MHCKGEGYASLHICIIAYMHHCIHYSVRSPCQKVKDAQTANWCQSLSLCGESRSREQCWS
jgi:hypothetical protein